jgi:hypothetical protein
VWTVRYLEEATRARDDPQGFDRAVAEALRRLEEIAP